MLSVVTLRNTPSLVPVGLTCLEAQGVATASICSLAAVIGLRHLTLGLRHTVAGAEAMQASCRVIAAATASPAVAIFVSNRSSC